MGDVEIISIDNKDYFILKEKMRNGKNYIYLSNVNDPKDVMIRKSSDEDKDLYVPLDDDKEFDIASLLLFKD